MKVGFAQINPTVGDLKGNFAKILAAYDRLAAAGADLVITPELAVTGYPPQDLVFKSRFVPQNLEIVEALRTRVGETGLLVGFVDHNERRGKPFHNAAALLHAGSLLGTTYKSLLPTYDVFDEDRYFEPAHSRQPLFFRETKIGVTICEDIWTEDYLPRPFYELDPVKDLVEQGAEVILNLSASPFFVGKPKVRREMIADLASHYHLTICYCNVVGGNDQLVFDGNSIAVNSSGKVIAQLPAFEEQTEVIDLESQEVAQIEIGDPSAELFGALSLGIKDYLGKCGFSSAVLGLSGGIDSAVVAALAVNALGASNVVAASMPSPYSSRGSIDDALTLARNLGITCFQVPISDAFKAFKAQFGEIFLGRPEDATEENMQSRLRGMILMALSNKFGHLLLTTGNKSELAVGYCTIYGDMAGGLAVISDVPKTMIYQLARWINRDDEIIPQSTINKPPSAELKPDQVDQDTLPSYEVLDEILRLYIEENLSAKEIVAHGFEEATVRWVQRRVDLNEYKRQQAAPGIKVTSRAFGVGRRMPIAQKFVD